ncbi:MAG: hypothetical protein U0930_00815 [Pirellulales bacterium]
MFSAPKNKATLLILITSLIVGSTGCNSFGAGKQMKQLEMENNRLLSEFRAERQRRESAERSAQQLELRLAESEKMLARQLQNGTAPSRLSSLPGGAGSLSGTGSLSGFGVNDPSSLSGGTTSGNGADLKWHRRN